jgi:hypothetical protein
VSVFYVCRKLHVHKKTALLSATDASISIKKIWQNSHTNTIHKFMSKTTFEWDKKINIENQQKHNVSFDDAQYTFFYK